MHLHKMQQMQKLIVKVNSEVNHVNGNLKVIPKLLSGKEEGDSKAVFSLDQLRNYGSKTPPYHDKVVRHCVIWRFVSP